MVVDYPGIQGGGNRNVGDNMEGQTPASYPTISSSSLSAAAAAVAIAAAAAAATVVVAAAIAAAVAAATAAAVAIAAAAAAVVPAVLVTSAARFAVCARPLDAIPGKDRKASGVGQKVGCVGETVVVVQAETWVPWVGWLPGPGYAPGW